MQKTSTRHLGYLRVLGQKLMNPRQLTLQDVLLLLGRLQGHGRGIAVVDASPQSSQGSLEILLVPLQTLQSARLLLQQLIQLVELTHLGLNISNIFIYIYSTFFIGVLNK